MSAARRHVSDGPVVPVVLAAVMAMLGVAGGAQAATISVPGDFATIQAALDAAGAGDTIEVASGVYAEKVEFTAGGDAADGFLTLRAAPGAPTRPVLDGTGVAGADMVLIDSKSWVRVEGFEIVNNLGVNDGSGVRVLGSGTNIEILDNVIHEIRGQHAMGVTVYGTEPAPIAGLKIAGNEIYDCDPAESEAMALNGNVDGFEVIGNVVRDVNNIGIVLIGGESDIQPDSSLVARNGVVRGNVVTRARSSYGGGYAGGIYVDGGRDIVIENNEVSECDLGIEVGAENAGLIARNVVVRNNVLHHNDKAGLVFGGYKASVGRANENVFRGNTLCRNNTLGPGNGEAEIWIQYAGDNVVENNIVYAGGANVFVASFAGSSNNAFDHNLYFSASGAEAGAFSLNGAEFAGFSAWAAGTGQDAASLTADPLLRDPESGDFHIDAVSPAFDTGNPAYVAQPGETDLDGAPRLAGARVDIGADEASCGDGTTDPGEECDDGDQTSGDGCDANCTLTACGNGIVTAGEACDDGNVAAGDCCDASCAFELPGSSCTDGSECTTSDVCDGAGACAGSATPEPVCKAPLAARGSRLKLRDAPGKDLLQWTWAKGAAVAAGAFGDPVAGDDAVICVYANDAGTGRVLVEARAPGGAGWVDRGTQGYRLRNSAGAPDGLTNVDLRPGAKARIKVKGARAHLDIEDLGLGAGAVVAVQFRTGAGECFGATFSEPFQKNDTSQLKASSD